MKNSQFDQINDSLLYARTHAHINQDGVPSQYIFIVYFAMQKFNQYTDDVYPARANRKEDLWNKYARATGIK